MVAAPADMQSLANRIHTASAACGWVASASPSSRSASSKPKAAAEPVSFVRLLTAHMFSPPFTSTTEPVM